MLETFKLSYLKLYDKEDSKKFSYMFYANNCTYNFYKIISKVDKTISYEVKCDAGLLLAWNDDGFSTVDLDGNDFMLLKEVLPKEFGITIPDFN